MPCGRSTFDQGAPPSRRYRGATRVSSEPSLGRPVGRHLKSTTGSDKRRAVLPKRRSAKKAGLDARDFESVYNHTYEDVSRWIRALGGPSSEQEDLIQEIYLIVHRKLPRFDGVNLGAWLYRITVRRVRDFRRLSWFRYVFGTAALSVEKLESADPNPVISFETTEKRRELERLLSRLSPRLRTTFILFEIEGYTAEEIADFQRIPLNTVRARIHRARKRLLDEIRTARDRAR